MRPSDARAPDGTTSPAPDPASGDEPTRPCRDAARPPPSSLLPLPRRAIGRYELLAEIGRGGMGVVYKAYRPDLKAVFAVKVLLAGDDAASDATERFRREAQTAARLRHPGIVPVHDFGVEDGKAYYAMEFVEGLGLDHVLTEPGRAGLKSPGRRRGLAARDAARIVKDVAETIEYAHRQGVIHRDLKPGNVLLDRTGRPRVVDFGMVKLLEHADVSRGGARTRSGEVFGTVAYMPPEQAAGEIRAITERSDVYSLGAMLYETVTGELPFRGASAVLQLLQVLNGEPVPPRRVNPDLSADLETVILKAMEKDPAKRYASAAALAEDLGRFLEGEAILARPVSVRYRVVKWVRRRRAATAAATLCLLAAAIAGIAAWRTRGFESAQAALRARLIEELRYKTELLVDTTLALRRAGASMRKAREEYVPRIERAVAEVAAAGERRAEPHYRLGRLYRALMRFPEARHAQDEALAREPDYAPSLYERAVLAARAHAERMETLREAARTEEAARLGRSGPAVKVGGAPGASPIRLSIPDDAALEARDKEAVQLRAGLRTDLARLEVLAGTSTAGAGEILTAARLACARGLALAYGAASGEHPSRARELLEEALRGDGTLEEAYEGLARANEGAGQWDAAATMYGRGLDADRGYVPFWLGRGNARYRMGLAARDAGSQPDAAYEGAIADFGRAVELDPTQAEPWRRRASARAAQASWRWTTGGDPSPLYDETLADVAQAAELGASALELELFRGDVENDRGGFLANRGRDPSAAWAEAVRAYGRAAALDPRSVVAWTRRANARTNLGWWATRSGKDPTGIHAEALADLAEATRLNPAWPWLWASRGLLGLNAGSERQRRGEDPGPLYAQALEDLARSLAMDPGAQAVWLYQGYVHGNWAGWREAHGEDAEPLYAAAVADYDRASALSPPSTEAWRQRAIVSTAWAGRRLARGEDPTPHFERAVADWGRVLHEDPGSVEALRGRGGVRTNQALVQKAHGGDPAPLAREALADLDQAITLDPKSGQSLAWRGLARHALGLWAEAAADLEAAIRLEPGFASQLRGPLEDARSRLAR
ncbi:MAG: protein kinase [Planctomycetes bacterium]|nr:protein kinase [Planctomycetota bacterium]